MGCNDLYVIIKGGLGNQMFQIACALQTAQKYNKTLKLNRSLIISNHHQFHDLNKTFELLKKIFINVETCNLDVSNIDFYIFNEKYESCFTYNNEIELFINSNNDKNTLLQGHFINYNYIPTNFYDLVKIQLTNNKLMYDFENTYFVHIRLGDYCKIDMYLIDLVNYYYYSISRIMSLNSSAKFIICTDQRNEMFQKIIHNFPKEIKYVIQDETDTDFDTLCLMSSCCGGVCSNSTLSYMGVFFQTNKIKKYIYFPYPYVKITNRLNKDNLPLNMYPEWCTIYNTLNDSIIDNVTGETIILLPKKNVYYINLNHRNDRKEHVERELTELGWMFNRFDAIRMQNNPALGCTLSHLKILENAKNNNLDYVIIVEDDILFKNKAMFLEKLNKVLLSGKHFDVCVLSGNLLPPYKQFINNDAIQVSHSQTTTGYIVKKHYYDTLINNIKTGANLLLRNPLNRNKYAIDMYWLQLQKRDVWIIIIPLNVTQIESYSDIEKNFVDYSPAMLNLKMNLY